MEIAVIVNDLIAYHGVLDMQVLLQHLYGAGFTYQGEVFTDPDGHPASLSVDPILGADFGFGVRLAPVVQVGPQPSATQRVAAVDYVLAGSQVEARNTLEDIPQPTLADLKDAKRQAVQKEKCRVRDAGFQVGGDLFDSDAAAQVAYLQFAFKLSQSPSFSTLWKASEGVWVTMDAALFAQVSVAGAQHISNVFLWQAARDAEIDVATLETVGAISVTFTMPG